MQNHIIVQKLKSSIDKKDDENLITEEELNNIPYDEIIKVLNYLLSKKRKTLLWNIQTSRGEDDFKIFINNVISRADDVLYIMARLMKKCNIYDYYFKYARNINMSSNLLRIIHTDLEFFGKLNILQLDNFDITPNFIQSLPTLSYISPLLIEFVKKYHLNGEYMGYLFESMLKESYLEVIKKIIGFGYPINLSGEILKKILEKVFNLDEYFVYFIVKNWLRIKLNFLLK